MSAQTPAALVAQLAGLQLLGSVPREQWDALAARCPAPSKLLTEAHRRNWLTTFQVETLRAGRANDLRVGSYALLELLGEGAMGRVYRGSDVTTGRVVAVKMLRPQAVANPRSLQRFQRECRLAFALEHPNIAAPIEAGTVAGSPFLVMEFVPGADLSYAVQQSGPLPIGRACEYARQAALGLQHAHERGILHRDIKPSNLRVAGNEVKILDFGLARLNTDMEDGGRLTQMGTLVGTVDYVAPEQAMDARNADIRADIYSLGCTLYYLLVGHAPFPGDDAIARLSARVLGEVPSVKAARAEVPAALDAVLRKMMAREPGGRYATPAEVATALQPFATPLAQQKPAQPPPVAVAVQPAPSAGSFWRSPVTLGIAIVGTATVLFALLIVALLRDQPSKMSPPVVANNDPPAPPEKQNPTPGSLPVPAGPLAGHTGRIEALVFSPDGKHVVSGSADKTSRVWDAVSGKGLHTLKEQGGTVARVAFSPDGSRIVTSANNRLKVWDQTTGKLLLTVLDPTNATIGECFSPDGKYLLGESTERVGDPNRAAKVWHLSTGKAAFALQGNPAQLRRAAYAAAGDRLATLGAELKVWNARTGILQQTLEGRFTALAFSADGQYLAGGTVTPSVKVWEAATGDEVFEGVFKGASQAMSAVALAPRGERVAAWNRGAKVVVVWQLGEEREVCAIRGAGLVVFGPDLKLIFAGEGDKMQVWDAQQGRALYSLSATTAPWFSSDGTRLASAHWNEALEVREAATGTVLHTLRGHTTRVTAAAFSRDGQRLVSGSEDGTIRIWDLAPRPSS